VSVSYAEREAAAIAGILSTLEIRSGWLVDVGAADGVLWSNTIGLVRNGWDAALIEADHNRFEALRENVKPYPAAHPVHLRVGCEPEVSLNKVLSDLSVPFDFDLLQIDIDGNDYWVWKSLIRRPKVVSIEYNSNFEPWERKAIKYDPEFRWAGDSYYGASVGALVALGKGKGYILVNHVPQSNLFFVREDFASRFRTLHQGEVMRKPIHAPTEKEFVHAT
jgi:hypothetical protein